MRKMTLILAVMSAMLLTGCIEWTSEFDPEEYISVISREDGSGTRGAFIDIFNIEETGEGTRRDLTTREATIVYKTDVMMASVMGDSHAIGYISLGSLNDAVKALKIDGVAITPENVQNGTYKISRPFNIATLGEPTGVVKDFINFIMSSKGQAVVANTYIPVNMDAPPYTSEVTEGRINISGSSSVFPVMEKLTEAYLKLNPNVVIEVQINDSTSGMINAMNGISDIGMASRELRESEKEHLIGMPIAYDGIAIIVNNNNPIDNMSNEQVRSIFIGEYERWSEVNE